MVKYENVDEKCLLYRNGTRYGKMIDSAYIKMQLSTTVKMFDLPIQFFLFYVKRVFLK